MSDKAFSFGRSSRDPKLERQQQPHKKNNGSDVSKKGSPATSLDNIQGWRQVAHHLTNAGQDVRSLNAGRGLKLSSESSMKVGESESSGSGNKPSLYIDTSAVTPPTSKPVIKDVPLALLQKQSVPSSSLPPSKSPLYINSAQKQSLSTGSAKYRTRKGTSSPALSSQFISPSTQARLTGRQR